MTLPAGITTCTVTIGKALGSLGEDASLSGTLTLDRRLVWSATGDTLYGVPSTVTPSQSGGWLSFIVAHVDQAGFVDQSGNSITGFSYTFSGRATFADGSVEPIVKHFQVFVGQSTLDLDLLPDGPATLPVTTPSPPLSNAAIAGFVSSPGATQTALTTSYAQRWLPNVAVLAGDVRQAPAGETIKRTANGTTRATYDTTEAALWSLVAAAGVDPLVSPPVLGRIDIVTVGKTPITSKVTYLDATMTITKVPGAADFFGKVQIRGRGNYTWTLDKKPYKIKTASKVSLMGMPAFDDWALLANATDPSKINTALAFAIGRGSDGLDWTPRYQFAELFLNGAYQGLYQLTETVKRGTDRVNIDKAGTTGLALTGGYMLEGDADYQANGDPGFTTTNGVSVIYDDPDGTVTAQADYIRARVQEFEDVLFGSSWLDPTTGYARFIDRDSFIDHYLIEELSSNQEAAWHSSQKFYRTRDTSTVLGRFFMGPLWDFDISFGSVVNVAHDPTGFYARSANAGGPGAKWVTRMFSDPAFQSAVASRWAALTQRLATVNTVIDMLSSRVAAAGLADQARWGYTADWATLAAFKKSWLAQRIAWLDAQLVSTVSAPGAVTGLAASLVTERTVTVAWTAPAFTSGAAPSDYIVQYRVAGASTWTTFSDGVSTATTASVADLTPSTQYEFRVAATNSVGTGTYSNTATATTGVGASTADNFTRADADVLGTTSTGGKAWTASPSAVWAIRSNKAVRLTSDGDALVTYDSTQADHDVSLTFGSRGSGIPGLIVASNGTDMYARVILTGSTTVRVDQIGVPGGDIFGAGATTGVIGAGTVLRAKKVGTSLTIYVDGSAVQSLTLHSSLAANTKVGIWETGASPSGTTYSYIATALST